MSLLKDSKYVQHLATQCGYRDLTQDSCKFILSQTELVLREIVCQASKYTKILRKDKISEVDINMSIVDLNLEFIINNSTKTLPNQYLYDQTKNQYFMKSENMEIQDLVKQTIKQVDQKMKLQKFQIKFDWITEQTTLEKQQQNKIDKKDQKQQNSKESFEEYMKKFYDPMALNKFIVKQQSPNFLTMVYQKGRVTIYELFF